MGGLPFDVRKGSAHSRAAQGARDLTCQIAVIFGQSRRQADAPLGCVVRRARCACRHRLDGPGQARVRPRWTSASARIARRPDPFMIRRKRG
jgi:hypothetical protein